MNAFVIGRGVRKIEGPRGTTPPCPEAKYAKGDVVTIRRNKAVGHFPGKLVVLVAIPPRFSPDYAFADLLGEARPLMVRRGVSGISYLMADPAGGGRSFVCTEKNILRVVGKVVIGNIGVE